MFNLSHVAVGKVLFWLDAGKTWLTEIEGFAHPQRM